MKRDNDFIRGMLFEAENDTSSQYIATLTMGAEEEDEKKHYHAELLTDAGFFVCINQEGLYRLTSQGHDFIEAIRSDTVWNKTKDGVKAIGGATVDMMAGMAVAYLRQEAARKLGIKL